MFDQMDGSTVRATRESVFRIKRDLKAVRGVDASGYISKTTIDTSLEKSAERSGWRDYFAIAVGSLFMSAIVLSALEVFGRLWANTGMIR
jgi:hypothetical protein